MSQQYEFSYGSTGSATGGQTGYTISSNEGAGVTRSSVSVLDGFKSGGQTYSAGESSGAQLYIAGGSGGLRGSTGGSTAQLYISGGSGGSAGYSAGQATQSFSQGGAGSYSAGGAGSYSAGGAGSYSAGGAGSYSAGGSASYAGGASIEASAFSQIEAAILKALTPIDISETEVITVNGQSGIWSNKSEVINWRGIIPITQYSINEDQNPEIIRKRTDQSLVYEQEIAVRYLRPPTPPPPGEITIRQEKNIPTPPAPPLIIRQQPPRPETPAPLIVREAPPHPPAQVGPKVITISGKRLPPPPRKVVIERLAPLPSKPQSVIIERWLPYNQQKRRVIFQRNNEPDAIVQKPKNVIIQWEAPQVSIKKEFKDLGIIRANPVDYVQKYGSSLRSSSDLPSFVREIRAPVGVVLAADHQASAIFELEGDVQALRLIDLDREGLSEYRSFLAQFGGSSASLSISGGGNAGWSGASASGGNSAGWSGGAISGGNSAGWSGGQSQSITISGGGNNAGWNGGSQSITVSGGGSSLITELLSGTTRSSSGKLSLNDAQRVYYSLNGRLGRNTSDDSARSFFQALDKNGDGVIDVEEFQQALISLS